MFAFTPPKLSQCLKQANFNVTDKRYDRNSYTYKLSCGLYITACNDGSMVVRTIAPQTWNEDERSRLMAFLPPNTIWRIKVNSQIANSTQLESANPELPPQTRRIRVSKGDDYEKAFKEFLEYEPSDDEPVGPRKPATPRKPIETTPYDPKDEQW
jgi:hypothetical protein